MANRPFFYTAEKPENSLRVKLAGQNSIGATVAAAPMGVKSNLVARFEQYYFWNAESKARLEGSKSTFLQNWAASLRRLRGPCRSLPTRPTAGPS